MASSSSPSSGAPAWRIRSPLKRSRRSPAQQPPPLAPPGEELKEEGHWPVRPGQTSPGREDSGGPARPRNKCFPQLCGRGEGAVGVFVGIEDGTEVGRAVGAGQVPFASSCATPHDVAAHGVS